jgi:hypothetical protein
MHKLHCLLALALSGVSGTSIAMPLNTGYDHGAIIPGPYASGSPDDYWIKIASYEPGSTTVPVARAFVLTGTPNSTVWGTMAGASWIGPRTAANSTVPTGPKDPSYSIYRKCFCLLQGFANPQLSISIRSDDQVQVWLNSMRLTPPSSPTTLVGPAAANHDIGQMPVYQAQTSNPNYFRPGRNCIYVLVEDYHGGFGGFILSGNMNAAGLMPQPAIGTEASFGTCGCPGDRSGPTG